MSRAASRKLSIVRRSGNDGRPELQEYVNPLARHASAFQDSNRRFARAYPIALAHLAEWRETDTCLCNERRREIANGAGDAPGNNLLEIHAARLSLATRTRADHEIIFPCKNWLDKLIHELGAIASVAV